MKNETIEEAAKNYGWRIKINTFSDAVKANELAESAQQDFIKGAEWQAKSMYSIPLNQNKMEKEEIKNDISVKSRLVGMTDEQLNIINFIIDYSFKDKEEVYTNGTVLVPLFRVLDAIAQRGEQYQESY